MVARPVDWSALGWSRDPIPGDPATIRSAAQTYQEIADAITNAQSNLRSITLNGRGEAIEKIKQRCDDLTDQIGRAHKVCDDVDTYLLPYAKSLEDAQAKSATALRSAQAAKQQYDEAAAKQNAAADSYNSSTDSGQRDLLRQRYYQHKGSADAAASSLAEAKRSLQAAIEQRDAAAATAAAGLEGLVEQCDLKDTFWDHVCEVGRAIADFCEWILPVLEVVGMVLGVVVLIASFIPPFTAIGATLAWVAFGVAAATLLAQAAVDARNICDGKSSWGDFGKNLLLNGINTALSFTGAKAFGKTAKLADRGLKVLSKRSGGGVRKITDYERAWAETGGKKELAERLRRGYRSARRKVEKSGFSKKGRSRASIRKARANRARLQGEARALRSARNAVRRDLGELTNSRLMGLVEKVKRVHPARLLADQTNKWMHNYQVSHGMVGDKAAWVLRASDKGVEYLGKKILSNTASAGYKYVKPHLQGGSDD